MNTPCRPWAYQGPVAALMIVSGVAASAESTGLDLRIFSGKDRIAWVLPPAPVPHALTTRRVQLEHSPDLLVWTLEGSEITGSPDGVGQSALDVLSPGAMRFYRLVINDTPDYLASGGAAILGYQTALAERLAANVDVSPSNFATAYPPAALLDGLSFNVAETDYYEEWNTDPAVWNALPAHASDPRLNDFRLDPASLEKLHANGFVVN